MDENQPMEVEEYPASLSDSEETQADSFMRLATRVLQFADNAESLILDLQYSSPPSQSFLGAIRSLGTHDRDDLANDSLEILRSINEHAQQAHRYLSIRDDNRHLKEAKLRDPLEYISRQVPLKFMGAQFNCHPRLFSRELEKLLQSLLSQSSPLHKWKALEKFNRAARKSMKDSALVCDLNTNCKFRL
jgi:hypothetical protein